LHDLQIAQSTENGDEGSARDISNKSPSMHALVTGSNESISAATGKFAIYACAPGRFRQCAMLALHEAIKLLLSPCGVRGRRGFLA
jgi:hypothetical protein